MIKIVEIESDSSIIRDGEDEPTTSDGDGDKECWSVCDENP